MKKSIFFVFLISLGIIFSLIIFYPEIRQGSENITGDFLGYGGCPNCNRTWYHNDPGGIMYSPGEGVLICNDCLDTPNTLSVKKICDDLRKYNWSEDKIKLVRTSVIKYQNGDTSLRSLF